MARTARKLDYATIAGLAEIACTDREIAAVIGISAEWLCKRKKADPKLREAIEAGHEKGKVSLRRVQWQKALEGHPTMLIWLGKQRLGQCDRVEHTEVADKRAVKAEDLTDDQLAAIIAEDKAKAEKETKK